MSEKKFELRLRRRNIPTEELLADLRRVALEIRNESLTASHYDDRGKFGKTTILRRFKSWHAAISAAGLKVVHNVNISDEALFENLSAVWQHLGRQPFGREMEKSARTTSRYSLGTYEKRFSTWNKALEGFIDFINGVTDSDSERQRTGERAKIPRAKRMSSRTPRGINWRLRHKVFVRDCCICKICGASPAKDPNVVLHVDHILPWSKGGETVIENLQTLCSVCNIGKGNEV